MSVAVAFSISLLAGCNSRSALLSSASVLGTSLSTPAVAAPLGPDAMTGDVQPVHDPSIIRQSDTYYLFSTDLPWLPANQVLPIRCSKDEVHWTSCGSVFSAIPDWVRAKVPGVAGLWAPDISYFNGLYHLYYAASTLGSQRSVIGFATNTTLDASDPAYAWADQGEVLESNPGDDFNAIDPNILVAPEGILLSYGSYWTGIKQVELDPTTGQRLPGAVRYDLATRPGVPDDAIEGASLVQHDGYFYLFVSIDHCCNMPIGTDNYKQIVGRSTSPRGPFVDRNGVPMLQGGGTLLLQTGGDWLAPGGGSAYIDPETGESLLAFHALKLSENGALYAWLKHISWRDGWPVLE